MMKKAYDAVATVGEYTDQQGQKKKRRVNVGVVLRDDQSGRMCLKLESVPVSKEWSGFIDFFEPQQRDGQRTQAQPPRHSQQDATADAFDRSGQGEDDIPF